MTAGQILRDILHISRHMLPLTAHPYVGEQRPCPVCGTSERLPVSNIDRRFKPLRTVACAGCGLFRADPMPSDDELSLYYRKYYRFDYQFARTRPSSRHLRKRASEAGRRAQTIAGLLPPGARSLDFGAGSGEFVSAMRDRAFDAYGFEPGEAYAAYAQKHLNGRIIRGSWQDMEYDGAFDLVTSFHVFEHLADPVSALRAVARWVKPGGLVFIEVPDAESGYRQRGFGSLHFAHVVGFNHHNLQLAAALVGLSVAQVLSPTSIVFRNDGMQADKARLMIAGASLSRDLLRLSSPAAYVRHNLGKLRAVVRLVGQLERPRETRRKPSLNADNQRAR